MKNEKLPTTLWAFLWFFIKKYKVSFSLYTVSIVLLMDLPMLFLQPYLLKIFFDKIADGTITIVNGLWLIVALVCSDLWMPVDALGGFLNFKSITKSVEDIRSKIFRHLITQSSDFFNSNYSGELVSKLNNITGSMNGVIKTGLQMVKNVFLLFAMVLVMGHFNVFLGLFTFLWVVLYIYISCYYMLGKAAIQSTLVQEQQNKITAFVTDDFMNIQNIKVFSGMQKEKNALAGLLEQQYEKAAREVKYKNIASILYFLINTSFSCFVVLFAITNLKNGSISLGNFAFLTDIVRRFIILARQVIWEFDSFRNAIVMKDSLGLITNDTEIRDKPNANKLELNGGKIVFRNVNFFYDKHL